MVHRVSFNIIIIQAGREEEIGALVHQLKALFHVFVRFSGLTDGLHGLVLITVQRCQITVGCQREEYTLRVSFVFLEYFLRQVQPLIYGLNELRNSSLVFVKGKVLEFELGGPQDWSNRVLRIPGTNLFYLSIGFGKIKVVDVVQRLLHSLLKSGVGQDLCPAQERQADQTDEEYPFFQVL